MREEKRKEGLAPLLPPLAVVVSALSGLWQNVK